MLIDCHSHVHPDPGGLGARQDASTDAFLREFDASPLDKIVLLPIEPVIPTAFVLDLAKKRPGKILCFGSASPVEGESAVRYYRDLVEGGEIRGLKLHPRRQGFSMDHVDTVIDLARVAAEADLPILMDSFPYGKGALRDCSLELVEAISEAVPSAKIIIAHMGGIRILDALILARTSYTIYLDLSLTYSVYRGSHIEQDIFYAIRRIGADRCIYGSDYPDVGLTASYEMMRAALDDHGFSSAEQDMIFGGTAQSVLGIS